MATNTTTHPDQAAAGNAFRRTQVLRIAGHFTTANHIPDQVLAIADPLMAWLNQAPNPTDRTARFSAILQLDSIHYSNRRELMNDPAAVLDTATAFHAFISA